MSRYRRARTPGATFFFTVTLADRRSTLLVDEIDRLRTAWRRAAQLHPFETIAVCILPDHLHAIWTLPPDDRDFSLRWGLIKSGFSRSKHRVGKPCLPTRSFPQSAHIAGFMRRPRG